MEKTINDIVKEKAEEEEEENCVICGRSLEGMNPEGWKRSSVCSGRCWADLYGEWDAEI